ncbi:hypothetical protein C8J56DRAFT_203440 [Mycena floridula]|nr:hypothetical protein C8J56DRAFT_203440 [Mycena floridula]
MGPIYSFNHNTTLIDFTWPLGITGIERIALSAQGDLQRILSAFFARPLDIVPTYSISHTFSAEKPAALLVLPDPVAIASASTNCPITQRRQVLLQCAGKTVCTATSRVHIKSPRSAHLFLIEKFAIGQMFVKLDKSPAFELLQAGFGCPQQKDELTSDTHFGADCLWRRYRLSVSEFDCEILEVFPSREMFTAGDMWLLGVGDDTGYPLQPRHLVIYVLLGFVILFQLLILQRLLGNC